MTINWGSVPDWCAGLGALTAIFFARRAAIAAFATNDQQSRQLAQLEQAAQDTRDEHRRHQASQIAVWLELNEPPADSANSSIKVCYCNASKQPVYNVRLRPEIFSEDLSFSIRIPVLPPTTDVNVSAKSSEILNSNLSVEAYSRTDRVCSRDEPDKYNEHHRTTLYALQRQARDEGISVEFHDSSGVAWRRNNRGVLAEIDANQTGAKGLLR